MKLITNPAEIVRMTQAKQALEVRLAWELLEVYNDPNQGFLGRLRELVVRSVDEMDAIANDDRFRWLFQKKWKGDWRKYAVCTDNGLVDWHPGIIKFKSRHFIAQHCADWIRIFGEVVEDVAKGEQDAIRKSYQTGDPYHWKKFKVDQGEQPDAGRRRVPAENAGGFGTLAELGGRAGPEAPAPPGLLTVWGFQSDISPSAGIKRWRVMERDTIGKMDQVFGLMPGAAISGTTTDNIYFFEHFGGLHLDPLFCLLPTAAIVAGGHHSLLEVGLPLTLNGYGNYKVGLYTTLFPRGSQAHNGPAGVSEIEGILKVAEDHPDNHLMVIHYAGAQPAGCWLYDSAEDTKAWRGMISGEPLLAAFKALPAWPDAAAVDGLRLTLGLER